MRKTTGISHSTLGIDLFLSGGDLKPMREMTFWNG